MKNELPPGCIEGNRWWRCAACGILKCLLPFAEPTKCPACGSPEYAPTTEDIPPEHIARAREGYPVSWAMPRERVVEFTLPLAPPSKHEDPR